MKKQISFTGEYEKKRISFREDGVLMLRLSVEYPLVEGETVYKSISDACEAWATKRLLPRIKEKYQGSGDPQKRFCFPPFEYSLEIRLAEQSEGAYRVTVLAILKRRGRVLSETKKEHILLKNGRMSKVKSL